MFIAMNRFKVKTGNEAEFEAVWKTGRTACAPTCAVAYAGFVRLALTDQHDR